MKNRIEYIDAMRGLAVFFVVIGHVFSYSIKGPRNVISCILSLELQIPLFFMVSGFFVRVPETGYWSFLRKKAFLLCVPAAIFMAAFVWTYDYNYISAWVDSYKFGYWFTFSLFEFILLYTALKFVSRRMKLGHNADNALISAVSVVVLYASVWCIRMENVYPVIKLLGLVQFKSFIYFVLGAILAERKMLVGDKLPMGGVVLVLCCLFHLYTYKDGGMNYLGSSTLWFALTTISGLLVILWGFKRYALWSSSLIGRNLQMIGRYTLDIYFIHYFFLPRNLSMIGEWFKLNPNPLIEYVLAMLMAVILIAASLLVGQVIRLSPALAHWLLAETNKESK